MNEQKIALIVDSGCDLPEEYLVREDVFLLPFHIIYKNQSFTTGVNITSQEIYARMPSEIPTTSLPSGEDIVTTFDSVKKAGFTSVLAITISANLSGTNNLINLIAKNYTDLNVHVFNTKNIGIGAGFFAIDAIQCIEQGLSFNEIVSHLRNQTYESKVFFSPETLDYLQKGGRIGLVSSILGSALRIKPVISCNTDGIYYTVKKARGRNQSLSAMIDLASEFAKIGKRYLLAYCVAGSAPEKDSLREILLSKLTTFEKNLIEVEIGAALGIHTGPGLIGIGIYRLAD